MIFLSLIFCALVFWRASRNQFSIIDPYTIFSLSFLYYGFMIPIAMTVRGDFRTYTPGLQVEVTPDVMNQMAIVLASAFLAFTIGFRSIARPIPAITKESTGQVQETRLEIAVFLGAIGVILGVLIIFFPDLVKALFSGYASKIDTIYNAATFSWTYKAGLTVVAILVNHAILMSKFPLRIGLVATLGYIVLAFAASTKDAMVFALISAGCSIFKIWPKHQVFALVAMLIGVVLALIYVVPIFSIYRGGGALMFDASALNPDLIYSDAIGPFVVLVNLIEHAAHFNEAPPLFQSLILWIPHGLWENRPPDLPESFARDFVENWRPGLGIGYSLLAEGYQRLGLWLSPVILLLCGLSFGLVQNFAARFSHQRLRFAMIITINGYLAFIANRAAFSNLITQAVQLWLPILLLLLIARLLKGLSFGSTTSPAGGRRPAL